MHPLWFDEMVNARIDELRRQAVRERRALQLHRQSLAAQAARRSLRAFGFLLVGAGLRLAMAGESRRGAGRGVA